MPVNFYYMPLSAPCMSVMLTAKAVGVDLNLKFTNLDKGDHLKPEFVKLNPQHCIPTLDDNGFVLWESRAILGYLVDQYGKDDSLYPKDPKKRAKVDQKLFFDIGTLYMRYSDYYYPVILHGGTFDSAKLPKLEEAYEFLDKFLEGTDWVAGDSLSIADLAIVTSVATAEVSGFGVNKYPNVAKWLAKAKKTIPFYEEIVAPGISEFKKEFFDKE